MERSDFLRELNSASRDLRDVLGDQTNRWVTNLVALGRGSSEEENALKIDRIYEILCYFTMLREVSRMSPLRFRAGNGQHGYRLPYGPAQKENFAYFRFEWNGTAYDLCNGSALQIEDGEPHEHPDVSLQLVESMDADDQPGEPVAIWDAKCHKGSLSKADIQQMYFWTDLIDLPPYANDDVLEQLFPPQFQVSAIISNANSKPNHRNPLLKNGFSVVLNFTGLATGDIPSPSRSEHIANQATALVEDPNA